MGRSFWHEYTSFEPKRLVSNFQLAVVRVPGLREQAIPYEATSINAWFTSTNPEAGVLVVHGFGQNRESMLPELEILSQCGLSVAAIDLPGQGTSGGKLQWGNAEQHALDATIRWLREGADGPHIKRLGAYGFSMGGYLVAQHAVRNQHLASIALVGTMPNVDEWLHHEYRTWGIFSYLPALLACRVRGMAPNERIPETEIHQLSPRPLLVVTGGRDTVVTKLQAERLYNAARAPKSFACFPDSAHGDYARTSSAEYPSTLCTFFRQSLLDASPSPGEQT